MREHRRRLAAWCGITFTLAAALPAGPPSPARASSEDTAGVPAPTVPAAVSTPQPLPPVPAAGHLAVPLDSRIYDDLEHFRAGGYWRGSLETRPLTRQMAARAVAAIRSAAAGRRPCRRDAVRLRRLEAAVQTWALERAPDPTPLRRPTREPSGSFELAAALRLVATVSDLDSLADLDRRSRRDQFFILSADAALGEHLFAQARFYEDYARLTAFGRGDRWADNLPPSPREVLTEPSARNDRAVIGVGWGWGQVRLGREDRRWGAGRGGTLFLSENPFPLDGLAGQFHTRFLAGSSLLAQLRRGGAPAPAAVGRADSAAAGAFSDAWLAAHRLELCPPGPLRVGLYEAVAWSGRGIDLAYANPAAFLLAVTQDLSDRAGVDDKKVVGMDVAAELPPVSLYGEVLINRVITLDAGQGRNSEATTWAQLAGLRWAGPLGLGGADLDLEYAHLDPEVYFHQDRDPGRAFLSQRELLGHWLGPNGDSFRARLAVPVGERRGTAAVAWEMSRWGVVDGLRGTELGFFGLRKGQKRWITGRIEAERILAAEWLAAGLRPWPRIIIDLEARLARVDRSGMRSGDGWQVELRLTGSTSLRGGE